MIIPNYSINKKQKRTKPILRIILFVCLPFIQHYINATAHKSFNTFPNILRLNDVHLPVCAAGSIWYLSRTRLDIWTYNILCVCLICISINIFFLSFWNKKSNVWHWNGWAFYYVNSYNRTIFLYKIHQTNKLLINICHEKVYLVFDVNFLFSLFTALCDMGSRNHICLKLSHFMGCIRWINDIWKSFSFFFVFFCLMENPIYSEWYRCFFFRICKYV